MHACIPVLIDRKKNTINIRKLLERIQFAPLTVKQKYILLDFSFKIM